MTPYHEHVIGAPDVCNNCLSLIREERVDPTRAGWDRECESHYARREEATEVGYGPARTPSRSKGVFCRCGVESARDRIWGYTEPDRERFKALLQNAVRTLEAKDISLARRTMVAHALQAYKDGSNVDGAIEAGLQASLATTAASASTAHP